MRKFLLDPNGEDECFFMFPRLYIRLSGRFRLRFNLLFLHNGLVEVVGDAISDTIVVYSPEQFPGAMVSTKLTRCIANAGFDVPVFGEISKPA